MLWRYSRRDGHRLPSVTARLAAVSGRAMKTGSLTTMTRRIFSACLRTVATWSVVPPRNEFRSLATDMTARLVAEGWQNHNFAPVPEGELAYDDTSVWRVTIAPMR